MENILRRAGQLKDELSKYLESSTEELKQAIDVPRKFLVPTGIGGIYK